MVRLGYDLSKCKAKNELKLSKYPHISGSVPINIRSKSCLPAVFAVDWNIDRCQMILLDLHRHKEKSSWFHLLDLTGGRCWKGLMSRWSTLQSHRRVQISTRTQSRLLIGCYDASDAWIKVLLFRIQMCARNKSETNKWIRNSISLDIYINNNHPLVNWCRRSQ